MNIVQILKRNRGKSGEAKKKSTGITCAVLPFLRLKAPMHCHESGSRPVAWLIGMLPGQILINQIDGTKASQPKFHLRGEARARNNNLQTFSGEYLTFRCER
jgi:hypothetical protein